VLFGRFNRSKLDSSLISSARAGRFVGVGVTVVCFPARESRAARDDINVHLVLR